MKSEVLFTTDEQRLRPSNSEVFRLWGDNTLIKTLTDWQPKYNIEDGISETCKWFSNTANLEKYKAAIYNL